MWDVTPGCHTSSTHNQSIIMCAQQALCASKAQKNAFTAEHVCECVHANTHVEVEQALI